MFRAEIEDTGLLKNSLQSISNVITEGVFQFREDGVHLIASDPAMVAMVDFKLERDAFSNYTCEGEKHVGVNIENLYSIVRRAGSNDNIEMELDDDASRLELTIKNNSTRSFSLALLNLNEDDIPSTSQLEFTVTADLRTDTLENAVGDASVVGDAVTIRTEEGSLIVRSEGDSSHTEFRIEEGSDALLEMENNGGARSMFSLDYLNKMVKAKKLSDTVKLSLGKDFPMRMEFQVPDKLSLGFILAPRIEEE